jgi:pimeloyl-ACP methyl ester carboxylesterase
VLLITGLAAKRQGWYQQIPAFSERYRTIIFDNRDIGDSDLATAPYRTADQADDAAALLHSLGVEHAYVVGISMGGFIALELTLRHPQLVQTLVLTSTSAGGPSHTQPSWRVRVSLFLPRMLPFLVRPPFRPTEPGKAQQQVYARLMAPGYLASHLAEAEAIAQIARYRPQPLAAYNRQLEACLHHNVAARLGQITVPTLVIHGAVDPLVPVANGKFLAAHIQGARLVIYPNTGHIPIIERADDYNREVLTFLDV